MEPRFDRVAFAEIADQVRAHLARLPSAIDSYLQDHILESNHYRIHTVGQEWGFASIHGERLITQFALTEPFRHPGQEAFAALRRMEQVREAFVPTSDEYFLAHALDEYRGLTKQAYFFATSPERRLSQTEIHGTLRPAERDDIPAIQEESGEFFGPTEAIERFIAQGSLFLTLREQELVGFGLLVQTTLQPRVASIGMYTMDRFRHRGVGTSTIRLLIAECERRGLRAVAGCWYYNHASKRTLERAGMYAGTRLLRIEF
jgi:RimJ/RimL family protein N-acetyltransferase